METMSIYVSVFYFYIYHFFDIMQIGIMSNRRFQSLKTTKIYTLMINAVLIIDRYKALRGIDETIGILK